MKDSSVCVFSCLILSQINITNKTAIASPPKKTQYFSSWEIINVSRIFKLCFNLNKRRREKNYSKWLQKHFKDNWTSGEMRHFSSWMLGLTSRSQGQEYKSGWAGRQAWDLWQGQLRGRPATAWAMQPSDLSRSHNCLSSPSTSHTVPTRHVSFWQRPAAFKPQLPLLHSSEIPDWHEHLWPQLK